MRNCYDIIGQLFHARNRGHERLNRFQERGGEETQEEAESAKKNGGLNYDPPALVNKWNGKETVSVLEGGVIECSWKEGS